MQTVINSFLLPTKYALKWELSGFRTHLLALTLVLLVREYQVQEQQGPRITADQGTQAQ